MNLNSRAVSKINTVVLRMNTLSEQLFQVGLPIKNTELSFYDDKEMRLKLMNSLMSYANFVGEDTLTFIHKHIESHSVPSIVTGSSSSWLDEKYNLKHGIHIKLDNDQLDVLNNSSEMELDTIESIAHEFAHSQQSDFLDLTPERIQYFRRNGAYTGSLNLISSLSTVAESEFLVLEDVNDDITAKMYYESKDNFFGPMAKKQLDSYESTGEIKYLVEAQRLVKIYQAIETVKKITPNEDGYSKVKNRLDSEGWATYFSYVMVKNLFPDKPSLGDSIAERWLDESTFYAKGFKKFYDVGNSEGLIAARNLADIKKHGEKQVFYVGAGVE